MVVQDTEREKSGTPKWAFLANLGFEDWEAERVADSIAGLGYAGIEWTMAHFDPARMPGSELDRVMTVSRDRGLVPSELVLQLDYVVADRAVWQNRVDRSVEMIAAAAAVNVPVVNVFTGPARWETGHVDVPRTMQEGEAWSLALSAFEHLVEAAETHKVRLAVEACWGMLAHDYFSLWPLFDRFGDSTSLAINLDPSHFVLHGNDIEWVVSRLADRIAHVHMKDVAGVPGREGEEFVFPMLGEGRTDWRAFFRGLNLAGYDGFASVEFESYRYYETVLDRDPVKAAEISMHQLRKLEALVP